MQQSKLANAIEVLMRPKDYVNADAYAKYLQTLACVAAIGLCILLISGCKRQSPAVESTVSTDETEPASAAEESTAQEGETDAAAAPATEEPNEAPATPESASDTAVESAGESSEAGGSESGSAEGNATSEASGAGAPGNSSPSVASESPQAGSSEGAGVPSDAKFDNPVDAISFARQASAKAAKLEKRGDVAEAYQQTLEAWQALEPHLANTTCQSLSSELMADIERLGEQMSANGVNVRGKLLKIK